MTSKAQKLRIKRAQSAGRPRKENVERYPSGQIKHSEREKDAKVVAIEARKRVHGGEKSNEFDADNPRAGYTLGRMFLDGKVSEAELAAGNAYAEHMIRYYSLVGIPMPSARAQDLHSIKGFGSETSAERARMAREASNKMMALEGHLLRLEDGPRVKSTVFNTVILDLEVMRTMPDSQLSWLKRGLREIHFRLCLADHRKAV